MSDRGEKFLARWSRRKLEEAEAPNPAQPLPPVADGSAPPALPPLEELTLESDYSGFLHPKVDAKLRKAALGKLFGDPHFNVMDGLDVYIDDYSKSDPLPAEMLARLKHGQQILAWAREDSEKTAAQEAAAASGAAVPATADPALLEDTQPNAAPFTDHPATVDSNDQPEPERPPRSRSQS